jgi:hypothetical protein
MTDQLGSVDEHEELLKMLDDLMTTYKYGYVPKCSQYHICRLNRAAAASKSSPATVVPLIRYGIFKYIGSQ